MTARKILPVVGPVTTDKVRTVTASALNRVKAETGLTNQAIAERAGKEDRKTAHDLLAGESTMDMVAFLKLVADPDFGPAFANDVLSPVAGLTVCAPVDGPMVDLSDVPLNLSELMTGFLRAYADLNLDHRETLALAKMLRPMMPVFQSIIADADRIAG